jgi:hypothetical protein
MTANPRNDPVPSTFADFLYAVIIAVAFSDLKVSTVDLQLCVGSFLLVVVLEDFFLYQTQIKPRIDLYKFASFRSLFFELAILLAWFYAFKRADDSSIAAMLGLASFFLFKFGATAVRLPKAAAKDRPFLYRDFTFLIPVIGYSGLALALYYGACHLSETGAWVVGALIWVVQTAAWWGLRKWQEP